MSGKIVALPHLDEEHELARGVRGPDDSLRVEPPLEAPEPLPALVNLFLLPRLVSQGVPLPLVPGLHLGPASTLLTPSLKLLYFITNQR